ncbi:MAG: HAMP domain-containing histidine kinase [Candidatus Pacebacteria bacterium]|nr:HAMP domain-containing histidine kinase [Candidatus Paceibacterota bacterium]
MNIKSSGPFAGWATQYRDKLRNDPFLAARLKIALLYFLCGVIIYIAVDYFIDASLKESFYLVASLPPNQPVDEAFRALKINLWSGRSFKLVLFALTAYWLAGFAMRPIKKSAELQRRFIATVSHELRTPLAVAKNTAEVALRNRSTLTQAKAIGVIESSLEEMNRISDIIQFLLTFSNFENRKKSFVLEQVELRSIAQRAILLVGKNLPLTNVRITLHADIPGYVTGSATALEELFLNLLKNAITYTEAGKNVHISITEDTQKHIILSIADQGCGIAEADIPNLFEPFFQGTNSPHHVAHGIGLGLSIVKEIVLLHGATIAVESSKEGSTFTVTFPPVPNVF